MSQVAPASSSFEHVVPDDVLERGWNGAQDGSDDYWQHFISNVKTMYANKAHELSTEFMTVSKQLQQAEAENKQLNEQIARLQNALIASLQNTASVRGADSVGSAASPVFPTLLGRGSRRSRASPSSLSFPKIPLMPIPEEDGVSEASPWSPSPPTKTSGGLLSVEGSRLPELLNTGGILAPFSFVITLRKADAVGLGVRLSYTDNHLALLVDEVEDATGAVAAWNRMVGSEKSVRCGDKIVGVNGITRDARRMHAECEEKQLLKIAIQRQAEVDATCP